MYLGFTCVLLTLACLAVTQQPTGSEKSSPDKQAVPGSASARLKETLESNVKTEWDAFKKKDKQSYSNLLADDFVAVEDDGQGMRNKSAAAVEVDRSVVSNYFLFALKVIPLEANAALVTYELTLQFPPKAQVRFKRVLVSEVWLKRNGQWKELYYQETRTR